MPLSSWIKLSVSGIYAFFNNVNGKCYVGSAVNLGLRFRHHITKLRGNKHKNKHFQSAWNKYGEHSFSWCVLEIVWDMSTLIAREAEWIATFENVYNKATAGNGYGVVPSEEKREKISTALKQRYSEDSDFRESQAAMLSQVSNTPEEKKRRSDYRKKMWKDPVYRAKMIAASKGKKRSEESRAKMSEAQRRRYEQNPEQLEKLKAQAKEAAEARWRKEKGEVA